MSQSISLDDAAIRLKDLVQGLHPGDVIHITVADRPVARITPEPAESTPRKSGFGACKGMLTIIREDDEHLADFKDYM